MVIQKITDIKTKESESLHIPENCPSSELLSTGTSEAPPYYVRGLLKLLWSFRNRFLAHFHPSLKNGAPNIMSGWVATYPLFILYSFHGMGWSSLFSLMFKTPILSILAMCKLKEYSVKPIYLFTYHLTQIVSPEFLLEMLF